MSVTVAMSSSLHRFSPGNWKISTRLLIGFGLGVLFTVCTCLIAWSSFKESEQSMRRLEIESIQGMVNTLKTSSEQVMLSKLSSVLARATSESERKDIAEQIDDQFTEINTWLDRIEAGSSAIDLSATRAVLADMAREFSNINNQVASSFRVRDTRKAALESVFEKHTEAIEGLESPLENAFLEMILDASDIMENTAGNLTGLIQTQRVSADTLIELLGEANAGKATTGENAETLRQVHRAAKMASIKSAEIAESSKDGVRNLLTKGVNRINTLLASKSEANFAAGMLAAAGNADDAETLANIEARFRTSAIALRGSLRSLNAKTEFPELSDILMNLLGHGEGESNLFDLREQEFSIAAELDQLVMHKSELMMKFNGLTESLTTNAQSSMAQETAALRNHLAASTKMLLMLALVSAVTGVLATSTITHSVVATVRSLTSTMIELADDNLDVDIPHLTRSDELGQMARSVAVFKNNAIGKRQVEGELADYREHLEELVETRTQEIERQKVRAEEALHREQELSGLQRRFVAMVSHEFRTPLAIIDGQAQLLIRKGDRKAAEQRATALNKIRDAITGLTGLMESVLSSASLEAGSITMDPSSFDLRALVQRACEGQQSISGQHRINIDIDALPERYLGDSNLLHQVVTNLLSNAVKYSPEANRVDITGISTDDGFRIAIRDFGVGIPEDELPKLCQRFFRASTSAGIQGTGIGLNLVKDFVEMHGGIMQITSIPGEGSTFTVRLPNELPRNTSIADAA